MSESNLEAKQQYLRVNIIEAGYDPQIFCDFCAKTHDLDDLQNWKMEQLFDIVGKFIKSHPKNGGNSHNTNDDEFGEFQDVKIDKNVPRSIPIKPIPEEKLAMNISDDVWKDFLTGPSILQSTPQPASKGGFDLPSDLLFPTSSKPATSAQPKQPEKVKESPLSPPSTIQPKQKTQVPNEPKVQKPVKEQKLVELGQKKKEKSKEKEGNAINLSNIKITTAKERLQPLLPLINDVVVTKTEQVSRNFLQSDYTLYHISFPPTQHIVKRKFSDFRKVRHILQKFYPFLRLPYLQSQGWISTSEGRDPQTLVKYKWMVQQFVRYVLLKSKELKDCQIVRILCGFSMNGQKDDLKKKIQVLQNASKPKCIGEVVLNDNNFVIPPIMPCDKLIQNTSSLLGQIDYQYEKLKKQLEYLFTTYDTLMKNYSEISSTFETLQSLTKKYNYDNNQPNDVRIFQGIKEMTMKMSNRINSDLAVFKNKIKNFIRYEKDNMTTVKQVFQGRSKIHSQYIKQGSPAFTSNSMRIQGSNVEIESAIPLEEPVRNNKNTLALQEAFWSFIATQEINRYWQHLRRKVSEHLTLIAYDELDNENENLNFWNTMIKRCVI